MFIEMKGAENFYCSPLNMYVKNYPDSRNKTKTRFLKLLSKTECTVLEEKCLNCLW